MKKYYPIAFLILSVAGSFYLESSRLFPLFRMPAWTENLYWFAAFILDRLYAALFFVRGIYPLTVALVAYLCHWRLLHIIFLTAISWVATCFVMLQCYATGNAEFISMLVSSTIFLMMHAMPLLFIIALVFFFFYLKKG